MKFASRSLAVSRALVCAAILLLPSSIRSQNALESGVGVSTATRDGRLAVFDDSWRAVRDFYYDPQLRGVDWKRIYETFRLQAAEARDEREFYAVLQRMVGSLDDPHTRVYAPEEKSDWSHPKFTTVGLTLIEIGDAVIVANVARGSEAERAGVRAGDELLTIDGEPTPNALARYQNGFGAATEKLLTTDTSKSAPKRRIIAARLLDGAPDTFATLELASPDSRRTRTVTLRRTQRERQPTLRSERLDKRGRFYLVRFDLFTPETASQLARLMRERLHDARGVVLDLRANGGGDAEAMTDAASLFLPAETPLGVFTDRENQKVSEPHTRTALLYSAAAPVVFQGALVILVDAQTASASEIFVAAMRDNKRATIIGERTCGCALGIRRRHALPDGGALDISEMDFRTPHGAHLEGAGVMPDETIAPSREDIIKRRDPAIKAAIERLKRD